MESPKHRDNILQHGLTGFGFGVAVREGQPLFAVQTFAGPGIPRGSNVPEAPVALPAGVQMQRALRQINLAREKAGVPPLEAHGPLGKIARGMISNDPKHMIEPKSAKEPLQALPETERQNWRAIQILAGRCGGCGTRPTRYDVDFFVDEWLTDPKHRSRLLARDVTHVAFAMQANGHGMKTGLVLLAQAR